MLSQTTIVHIEDDPILRESFREWVAIKRATRHVRIQSCANNEDAKKFLLSSSENVCGIIQDLNRSVTEIRRPPDGLIFIREFLTPSFPNLPILVLSGEPSIDIVREVLSAHNGNIDFMSKDFDNLSELPTKILWLESEFLRLNNAKNIGEDTSSSRHALFLYPRIISLSEARRYSELIELLISDKAALHHISSRQFEEITAEMFHRMGHDVTLTPQSNDGGFDIALRVKDGLLRHLVLVECKRYVDKPVGVGVVRSLLGVVDDMKASSGLLVTTSRFTRGAKTFELSNEFRIQLADLRRLQEWLGAESLRSA